MSNITKEKLMAGLRSCMEQNEIEDITVKQICEASHLSRQSFYRTCFDKYDLLNGFFDELLMESFREMGNGKDIFDALLKKFAFIRKESKFFQNAFRYDLQNNLHDHDIEEIMSFYQNLVYDKTGKPLKGDMKEILEMYCVASVHETAKWVLKDMPISDDELARLLIRVMPNDLQTLFQDIGILTLHSS